MIKSELIKIILLIILHTVAFIFTELIDIVLFKKILLNSRKKLFYPFLAIESVNYLLLIILFILCIIKFKLYSCITYFNIFYLIISIIILIFLAIYYYFLFEDYVIGKSILFENLLILTGSIFLHIFNNFLFIPEFICIRIFIKKTIEGEDLNFINQSVNVNNNSESKKETTNSNINNNRNEENNSENGSKKDQTFYIIVGGNTDNNEGDIVKVTGNYEKKILKTENNVQNIDTIINKMNDITNLSSGRAFLKKIKVNNEMKQKSISNLNALNFEVNSIFPNMRYARDKISGNKSNKHI